MKKISTETVLFIVACLLATMFLASCGTVHKTITSSTEKVDSVKAGHVDSVAVHKSVVKQTGLDISDLNIEIDYPPAVDETPDIDTSGATYKLIQFVKATRPSKIVIHAGQVKDTSSVVVAHDSVRVIKSDTSILHADRTNNVRIVDKKTTPFWVYFLLICSIIVLIIYAVIHFNLIAVIKKII